MASADTEQISEQIRELRAAVLRVVSRAQHAESALEEIRLALPLPENILRQRGFRVLKANPVEHLLVPHDPQAVELYLRLLRRYSFRLFLRDAIRMRRDLTPEKLTHYCSARKARVYLEALAQMGLANPDGTGTWQLAASPSVRSFGDTLEWYVAQVLRRELAVPASWCVSLKDLERGGDFDVIGVFEGALLYVETKSSPPKNVHMDVISGFVGRIQVLRPDMAVLLMDTHLRMEDKINKMLRAAYRESLDTKDLPRTVGIARGVFRFGPGLYACNSKPDIRKNLLKCFQDYLQSRRQR